MSKIFESLQDKKLEELTFLDMERTMNEIDPYRAFITKRPVVQNTIRRESIYPEYLKPEKNWYEER